MKYFMEMLKYIGIIKNCFGVLRGYLFAEKNFGKRLQF